MTQTLSAVALPNIPCMPVKGLEGYIADASSWHCRELDGLEGREKAAAQVELYNEQENFEYDLGTEAEDAWDGWLRYYEMAPRQEFWQFCADKGYTLKDLLNQIYYNGGFVKVDLSSVDYDEMIDTGADDSLTVEQIDVIIDMMERTPEAFVVQADGTYKYKD